MRTRTPLLWTLVISLVALTGCSDGVGPGESADEGTYALSHVNGRAIPAIVAEGGGQRYIVLGLTLRFSRDGTVARSVTMRHLSTTPPYPPDTTYHHTMNLPYVLEGNRLIIGYRDPCPPNASCIGFEEGELTISGLRVVGRLLSSREPVLTFRRVRP